MTSTKPPDPTTSLIFFVVLTSIFIVAKYFVTKITVDPCPSNIQNLSGSFTMTGAYILLLILGNYFINLNVTTAICGEVQWKNTFITTVIPWVLIFGTMNLLLTIYPGWLSPFSNTIGYLVAKLMGLEETVEAILKPNFIKGENVSSAAQKNIGEALEHTYSDKSLIINEITENNFCTFWDNMNAAGLFDTKKGATLENKIAVFAVNLLGNPCPLEDLKKLCDEKDLILLEDNCESLGAKLNGKQCATFGKMGTYSFFFSHHLQTMEGGMVVTNDADLYEYLLPLRAHGWIRDLPAQNSLLDKTGDDFEDSFKFVLPGYTVRLLEMSGATGLVQLTKWPTMLEIRRKNAQIAQQYLASPHMHLQSEIGESSWFGFGLTCIGALEGKRKQVINLLQTHGVECRPIVAGNFMRNPVIDHLDYIETECPNADYIHDNGFFIGNDCVDLEYKIKAVGRLIGELV